MFSFSDHTYLFFDFLIVLALSFIIGLEQRRHHLDQEEPADQLFGTDRTFTFVGILGFILFTLDPERKILFLGGGLVVSIFLAIFYNHKITQRKKYGLTSILSALITYCLAPLVITQPQWLALLIVVTVLVFTEMKEEFINVSKKFGKDEFITLAKFILIAGIILPNLSDEPVLSFIPLSPYKMWLAIVVVSGISYFSYLLQKFVFPKSGIVLTGILGGLYSSTAVSLILSRKSHDKLASPNEYAAGIIFATSVMYIRIFLIVFIFNTELALILLPYAGLLLLVTLLCGFVVYRSKKSAVASSSNLMFAQKNPLEFRVAMGFALFYILFMYLLNYSESHYGEKGLNLLSFIAGFADVDSYVMNLVQGKFAFTNIAMTAFIIKTTTSNNFIKTLYSLWLAEKNTRKLLLVSFLIILVANAVVIWWLGNKL